MNVVCEASELKKRSEELAMPLADLLWGYVVEDMMLRIEDSDYHDILWLENGPILGKNAYRERAEKQIRFFYQESDKVIPPEKLKPGQKLSKPMAEQLMKDVFMSPNPQNIVWQGTVTEERSRLLIELTADYYDMQVPITLVLHSYQAENQRSGRQEEELTAIPGKKVSYLIYAPENQLSREIVTIMDKLELVADMGCFFNTYQILHNQSLSGRYVIEELEILTESSPKLKTEHRLEQIAEYRNYAYMRKRWEKYLRNHGQEKIAWEEAIDLIIEFLKPIWHSLCEHQIFFDDWMPELGRFLG